MERIELADMGKYTSFKTGGKAGLLLMPGSEEELGEALEEAERKGRYLILGNGSDTLFADDLYDGIVIKLGESFSDIKVEGEILRAGASALLSTAAKAAQEASLTGMEEISGIPGSVGGAVFMNAGAYGREIKDVIRSVRALRKIEGGAGSYETVEYGAEELDLSYRHSRFTSSGEIILSAEFGLEKGDREGIDGRMKDYTDRRNSKQPLNLPSGGSFFKRPEGNFAGKLIEDAGLKGLTVGGAQVSEKHAGFIVNTGDATPRDIIDLMRLIQNTVNDRSGVMLEPEVRIITNGDNVTR